MDSTLKAAVDSAANMLRRTRGGPEGVASAAAAVDSVRRALNDTHASLSLRPRIADDSLPMLLSTQKPVLPQGSGSGGIIGETLPRGSPSASSNASSGGGVNMAMAATAATVMYGAAASYDKAAAKFLDGLG